MANKKIEISKALEGLASLPRHLPLRVDDTMRVYDPKNGAWWKFHVQFEKDCQPLLLWLETDRNDIDHEQD